MSEAFSASVSGLKEVRQALYAYSQQLGDKVVIDSLKQGALLVQKAARAAAPVRTGRLRRAIVVKKSKIYNGKRNEEMIGVYLTIRTGKGKKDPKDGYYGRWQEEGWNVKGASRTLKNTATKKTRGGAIRMSRSATGGRATLPGKRYIPGKHFMRNAFMRNRANAVRMIIAAANRGVELLARKGIA